MSQQSQHAVIWETVGVDELRPKWTSEPSFDAIKVIVSRTLHTDEDIAIDFLAQGAFNKLYQIKIGGEDPAYVIRVTLPVDPHVKVESEAATIKLLEQHTTIPVANVIAFDASTHNELGYEWILMRFRKGRVLETAWKTMTWQKKEALVRKVAQCLAQLFNLRFKGIGSVYLKRTEYVVATTDAVTHEQSDVKSHYVDHRLSAMVSMALFWNGRLQQIPNRGPFANSSEWLATLLQLIINENGERIRKLATEQSNAARSNSNTDPISGLDSASGAKPSTGEALLSVSGSDQTPVSEDDELEGATTIVELSEKLLEAIPTFFPKPKTNEAEVTYLYHHDLSWHNILADEEGALAAILDWECVSTVPLWKARQYPNFLQGNTRDEAPQHEDYLWPEPEKVASGEECEQVMYGEHVLEYEQTQLRAIFDEEMQKLIPQWLEVHPEEIRQADFGLAVDWCDGPFTHGRVRTWLESTLEDRNEYQSLQKADILED